MISIFWEFFIEICVQNCSIILFIGGKCISFPKNIYFFYIKKNSDCTDTFQIIRKIYIWKEKYATVTHGSKRGGLATCIVICLITFQANTWTYFKTTYKLFTWAETCLFQNDTKVTWWHDETLS